MKEYLKIKELLSNNQEVKELLDTILVTQEKSRNFLKENKIKEYNETKKELESLKNKFNEIPLINNYIEIKEKVLSLIEQIATIIGD